mmetsp:Transcript_5178/g.17159  ORF Transcript_5178/g.17159 Transcript_5178/m.17159 type:complete len:221 (+) Transcript_5178:996-1658(+)
MSPATWTQSQGHMDHQGGHALQQKRLDSAAAEKRDERAGASACLRDEKSQDVVAAGAKTGHDLLLVDAQQLAGAHGRKSCLQQHGHLGAIHRFDDPHGERPPRASAAIGRRHRRDAYHVAAAKLRLQGRAGPCSAEAVQQEHADRGRSSVAGRLVHAGKLHAQHSPCAPLARIRAAGKLDGLKPLGRPLLNLDELEPVPAVCQVRRGEVADSVVENLRDS